jgi:hypothetical protein
MTSVPATTPIVSVIDADGACPGYIIKRGPAGFEAFDREDHSLGTFASEADAIEAIKRAEGAQ